MLFILIYSRRINRLQFQNVSQENRQSVVKLISRSLLLNNNFQVEHGILLKIKCHCFWCIQFNIVDQV